MTLTAVKPPIYAISGLSQAMIVEGGRLVFLSGHVPLKVDGTIVEGGLEEQLVSVYDNLAATLKAAGASFKDVVRLTTYVVDYTPDAIPVIRGVRDRYINLEKPPASTLLGVAALAFPGLLVEVEAVAVLP